MTTQKYITYFRVSTDKQDYGIDAQRRAVADFLAGVKPVASFTEKETGKTADRPQLQAALAACRKHKATLVIAKLDRLARNVAFIAGLMETKVPFVCTDMPNATPFMLHVYAAVAEEERRMIAARTRAGLAAARERGVILGSPRLPEQNAARQAAAAERARAIRDEMQQLSRMSAHAAAAELNRRGVATATGAPWSAKTVIRVRERLEVRP